MTSLLETVFGQFSHTASRGSLIDRLNARMALHRSRTRLGELDPHMLNDIGLTEKDARAEANRPIWDAPETWKA